MVISNFEKIILLILLINNNAKCKNIYNLTSGVYEAIEIKISDNVFVHRLMNIPYARTPFIFQKPNELLNKSSSNVQKTNKWPNMCVQTRIFNADFYGNLRLPHKTFMSFDCLTINLYIPMNSKNATVMLFIHGGSNAVGTSSYVDGSILASYGNVIVATINYRLDVMGFFNMHGNDKYKGNYGLWDQLSALKWLHKNCANFGCNPDSITLFGHSAGSANVLFHAMSNYSRPYIKRVIMQSGSGLAHWATNYEKHLLNFGSNKKALNLFKKSRYVHTMNDTLFNFLTLTKCNQTQKFKCLKEKLNLFKELNRNFDAVKLRNEIEHIRSLDNNSNELADLTIFASFWNLVHVISFDDFCLMFGYMFKQQYSLIKKSANLINSNNEITFYERFFHRFSSLNGTKSSVLVSRMRKILIDASLNSFTHNTDTDDACYADLHNLVQNYESGFEICQFLKEINVINSDGFFTDKSKPFIISDNYFCQSPVIKFFLSCFTETYLEDDESDHIFGLKDSVILNEMEQCVNAAINNEVNIDDNEPSFKKLVDQDWNEYDLFKDNDEDDDNFKSSLDNSVYGGPKSSLIVKEIACLSNNINNLHRASIDYDYISDFPHFKLTETKNLGIDLMMGVTTHESFYFLEFNYSFDEILKHTFIYSSLLNLTTDLIDKLTVMEQNSKVNICMKKQLLDYYNIDSFYLNTHPDSLTKSHLTLSLIDDFEFNLPMITHLKLHMDSNDTINEKLYAYEFNFKSSFNYMLNKSMPYSDVYTNVYTALNNSVVPHFSELDYVFGLPILSKLNLIKYKTNSFDYNYNQNEFDLSILMIKYWSNFAKFGDPSYGMENDKELMNWTQFNKKHPNILNINSERPTTNESLIKEWLKRHEFWYETLPNKIYDSCLQQVDKNCSNKIFSFDLKRMSSYLILIIIVSIMFFK